MRRVVFFELNEVPWRIIDEYVDAHPASHLARLTAGKHQWVTHTADRGHLSPWTTWPTMHRGVNDERHGIASLGQDLTAADAAYPPIWELLRRAGVSVGVGGSLHSYPLPEDVESYSFYLPDTFASEPTAFPTQLEVFQAFNLTMARVSARNVDPGVPIKEALRVLRRSAAIGIRPQTYAGLARQLLAERRTPQRRGRRRTFQALLAFDVVMRQLRLRRPAFSTFFTNHVASAMHRYWAAARPGDYDELQLGQDWLNAHAQELPWAMDRADEMIGRAMALCDADPDLQLWVVSSMGQGPTVAQPLETQLYLTDTGRFLRRLGVSNGQWEQRPAMLPQANVSVAADLADHFEAALRTVAVAGTPIGFRRDGQLFSMDFGQANLHDRTDAVTIDRHPVPAADLGLQHVEIEDRSDTTAYHVPEGVLAVYDPREQPVSGAEAAEHRAGRGDVSVLAIAPALLHGFGVPAPDYLADPGPLAEILR